MLANLAAFEAAHNPDHGAGPGARYGQPAIDSDPYDFVAYRGGFAVADAAAQRPAVGRAPGAGSRCWPCSRSRPRGSPRRSSAEIRAPASLRSFPVQSVPTCVAVGPDGALYVGELTGWPYQVGKARIWRIAPG